MMMRDQTRLLLLLLLMFRFRCFVTGWRWDNKEDSAGIGCCVLDVLPIIVAYCGLHCYFFGLPVIY